MIYEATIPRSVTVYFDAIRAIVITPNIIHMKTRVTLPLCR